MSVQPPARLGALARFCGVGALGFAVDSSLLLGLMPVLGSTWGRVVSLLGSMTLTWVLNRSFTFDHRPRVQSRLGEWGAYCLLMGVGALVNFAVYWAYMRWTPQPSFAALVGVALGSGAGLCVNFVSARFLLQRVAGEAPVEPA
ncbi:GtrA family protein [Inhella gelatinilytica]|uniref:GtrA family protein n=1 Tax=Inhella gelatinilytica TaxID=2795030 RepID=A0A931NEF4_9BURK|nr:GtrA family protein [Inhella gelatinilytica]MBH9553175.1 GtrA family protein [Inhella gelatinilytica]